MAATAVQNFSRFCTFPTQYRHLLCSRLTTPNIQQTCGLKKSTLEKIQALPEKPKRPMTPYFRFLAQVRPSVVQKHPNLKVTEIAKLISQEWDKADANLRKELETQYRKELENYMSQKMKYDSSLTPEQKADIKQIRIEQQEAKEKKKMKQRIRELGRPKKPQTSFILFMNSNKTERGNLPFREWQLKMSTEWENMPQTKKDKYIEQAKKEQEIWREQLTKWEEQMIRQGNVDVIRTESLLPKMKDKK